MKYFALVLVIAAFCASCRTKENSEAGASNDDTKVTLTPEGHGVAKTTTVEATPQEILQLTAKKLQEVETNTGRAPAFIASYTKSELKDHWTLEELDEAFAGWLKDESPDKASVSEAVNIVGAAFGSYCVEHLDMRWVKVKDEIGTDFAIKKDVPNVLGFPYSSVLKRVDSKEHGFLVPIFNILKKDIESGEDAETEEAGGVITPPIAKKSDPNPEDARARDAMSPDPQVRFAAVRSLATSPFTEEAADVLTKVASDITASETTRGYAAMGLRNFSNRIPPAKKEEIKAVLSGILEKEMGDTPDGIIRTLLAWGDVAFVEEVLGDHLDGHSMQVEILELSGSDGASDNLWSLYLKSSKSRKATHYNKRAAIGRALVKRNDIRGIDILIELLPIESAPGPQYRNNVYNFLKSKLGRNFGYDHNNYHAQLEEAIPKMCSWWEANRSSFSLRKTGKRR